MIHTAGGSQRAPGSVNHGADVRLVATALSPKLCSVYIRFVVESIDTDSLVRRGVVLAAHELKDEPRVSDDDRKALRQVLRWLDLHLTVPSRFNRTTSKGYYRRRATAISWLKDTAAEHLAQMRRLAEILDRYGHRVSMLREMRPGYVVHEDEFQVVAEPFADTTT